MEVTSRIFISGMEGSKYREVWGTGHVTVLGAGQSLKTIGEVIEDNAADTAFNSFSYRILQAIRKFSSAPPDAVSASDLHQVL